MISASRRFRFRHHIYFSNTVFFNRHKRANGIQKIYVRVRLKIVWFNIFSYCMMDKLIKSRYNILNLMNYNIISYITYSHRIVGGV